MSGEGHGVASMARRCLSPLNILPHNHSDSVAVSGARGSQSSFRYPVVPVVPVDPSLRGGLDDVIGGGPGWLVGIQLKAVEQLPCLGFELADEGEIAFGVPVCHWSPPLPERFRTRRRIFSLVTSWVRRHHAIVVKCIPGRGPAGRPRRAAGRRRIRPMTLLILMIG